MSVAHAVRAGYSGLDQALIMKAPAKASSLAVQTEQNQPGRHINNQTDVRHVHIFIRLKTGSGILAMISMIRRQIGRT